MRNLLTVVAAAAVALCAFSARAAPRVDTYDAASLDVHRMELLKNADGGCAVRVHATFEVTASLADGGTSVETMEASTPRVELAGASRTIVLDLLSTKGPLIFKNAKGL